MESEFSKETKQSREFNKDELFLLAIHMDLPELLNFCQTSSKHRKLCNTDRIWEYKLEKEFPGYKQSVHFKDMTLREKYKTLYALRKLNSELNLKMDLVELYKSEVFMEINKEFKSLPKEIGILKNVKDMYLTNSKLTTLPGEIGQLKNLEKLYIPRNQIETLPVEMKNLINLKNLGLNYNNLTHIPEIIFEIPNLEELILSSNKIKVIPRDILKLKKLELLNLSYNPIDKKLSADVIAELINRRVTVTLIR